jgi:hypothetical protein
MTYIFISYARENEAYANKLGDFLMTAGFDIWLDDRTDETVNLVEVVQKSAAVLFLMTTKGGESRWMQRELAAAVQKSKPYYPLLLEGRPWTLLRGTPFTDVHEEKMPPQPFVEQLAQHLPQKPAKGVNLAPRKGSPIIPNGVDRSVTTMARPEGFKELADLLLRSKLDREEKKP